MVVSTIDHPLTTTEAAGEADAAYAHRPYDWGDPRCNCRTCRRVRLQTECSAARWDRSRKDFYA